MRDTPGILWHQKIVGRKDLQIDQLKAQLDRYKSIVGRYVDSCDVYPEDQAFVDEFFKSYNGVAKEDK